MTASAFELGLDSFGEVATHAGRTLSMLAIIGGRPQRFAGTTSCTFPARPAPARSSCSAARSPHG